MSAGKSNEYDLVVGLVGIAAAVCLATGKLVCAAISEAEKAHAWAQQRHRIEEARRQAEEQRLVAERQRADELKRFQLLRDTRERCKQAAGGIDALESRVRQLQHRFPTAAIEVARPQIPEVPQTEDLQVLERHSQDVKQLLGDYGRRIQEAADRATGDEDFRHAIAAMVDSTSRPASTAAEALASYAEQASGSSAATANAPDRSKQLLALRASFAEVPAHMLPDDMPALFEEFATTASHERAESLAIELQSRARQLRQDMTDREQNARTAAHWVAELTELQGADSPPFEIAKLRHQLVLVAQGDATLTPQLEKSFAHYRDQRQAELGRDAHLAAAVVLESTLHELGYATDSIQNTLFAEGGTIHYQRSYWGGYYMQLRLLPSLSQANFSLVRVGQDDPTADAARQAEYCSEENLREIREALEQQGIRLTVKHANEPGAVRVPTIQESDLGQQLRDHRLASNVTEQTGQHLRQRPADA